MSGDTAGSVLTSDRVRVALVLITVGDLGGSGGTERHFSDLFEFLRRRDPGAADLVTSATAVRRLREAGRLANADGIIALPLGGQPARTKAGILWMTLVLLWTTIRRRWDVVHLCQPTPAYLPYAAALTWLPRFLRPRVTMTVVDCTLAHNMMTSAPPADLYERQVVEAHRMYARWTRLDGIYSWYRAFVAAATRQEAFDTAIVRAAAYCFTDVGRFAPGAKEPLVVFAGRFSAQKRPLLFVDAIDSLCRRYPDTAAPWRFAMYGGGLLEAEVRERIAAHGLSGRIELTRTPDMAPVFARSKVFVSTQAYDNFTSLAMLEAMAAGNAIVAEDTGQTAEFVKTGANGYLVPAPATADAFADAIVEYIAHPEAHERMAAASRALATDVHTIEHFADDITLFWSEVAPS
jgi:glycosyltransferase involved in cell wall biosynthesis